MKPWNGRPISARQRGTFTYGALAVNATSSGTVTFAVPFGAAPDVSVVPSTSRVNLAIENVTATGFTWHAANWSPAAVGAGFTARWHASL